MGRSSAKDDALLDELRQLARMRELSDYRGSEFPLLGEFGRCDSSADALRSRLDTAIGGIPDQQYRDAAFAIFGSHDRRWSSLKFRQSDAARAFGIGYEGFRRKRTGDRPSLYDQTLQEMAAALHRLDEVADADAVTEAAGARASHDHSSRSAPAAPPGAGRAAPRESPSGARRSIVLGMSALISASAAFGLGMLTDRLLLRDSAAVATAQVVGGLDLDLFCGSVYGSGSRALRVTSDAGGWRCADAAGEAVPIDFGRACAVLFGEVARARLGDWTDPEGWDCFISEEDTATMLGGEDGCPVAPGAYLGGSYDDFARYADGFRSEYEAGGGASALGCPAGPVFSRGEGVVQELRLEGRIVGTIYGGATDDPVLLTGPAFDAYQRHGGGHGSSLGLMGFPVSEPVRDGSAWVVPGSNGGALVSGDEAGPYYMLPQPSWQVWRDARGALGPPISDFYGTEGGVRQDFVGGFVAVDATGIRVEFESG